MALKDKEPKASLKKELSVNVLALCFMSPIYLQNSSQTYAFLFIPSICSKKCLLRVASVIVTFSGVRDTAVEKISICLRGLPFLLGISLCLALMTTFILSCRSSPSGIYSYANTKVVPESCNIPNLGDSLSAAL